MFALCYNNLNTGDVNHLHNYVSFKDASNSIRNQVQAYIEDNLLGNNSQIVSHHDCTPETLKTDTKKADGYWFIVQPTSALMCRKVTDAGWVSTDFHVETLGKFVILEIPALQLDVPLEEDEAAVSVADVVSSEKLQHGKHVSLVDELKTILQQRRSRIIGDLERVDFVPDNPVLRKFESDLLEMRRKLNLAHLDIDDEYDSDSDSD